MLAEDSSPDDSPVHALFADYVARLERGEVPGLDDLARTLANDQQRRQLRELVRALHDIDQTLPAPIDPGILVGDRYLVRHELGVGGMGRVMLVHDQKNDRDVALKVLRFPGKQVEAEALLRRERKALVRLQHPNIVRFLDADRWRDCFYLVMELVLGTNMAEVLDGLRARRDRDGPAWRRRSGVLAEVIGRPLPSGRQDLTAGRSYDQAVAAIIAACASAIESAHAVNVVHRDLKPGNVMLTGGGNPVLLDFGLAGMPDASRGPLSSGLFGTPSYLAPEQARAGCMGTDPRSDLYKLGAILYELLTLVRPWADQPADQVVAAIRDQRLPRARAVDPAVPFELDCICAQAMADQLADRYQTATEVRVDLERFLAGRILPVAARAGAPPALRGRYFVRRHRLLLTVALVALAGAVLALLRP